MATSTFSRRLRVVAFNLALLFVLIEAVALVGYFVRTGDLYYLAPPSGRSVPVKLTGGVEQYRLHPYFGFVNRPGSALARTNNFGFVSPHRYPYTRRRPGEYLVGVFGGSVADYFAVFESEHRILTRRLAEFLGKPAGDVTILSFAQGGYKQPQQLLVYDYFRALGQELDLVVNIDGFNEIALAGRNASAGVALDMPSMDHLRPLREVTGSAGGLGGVERMLRIRVAWTRFARTFNRAWSGEGWELRLASGFLNNFLIYKLHLRRYRSLLAEHIGAAGVYEASSWLSIEAWRGRSAAPAERAVALWARSSELLDRAQKAAGGIYLHFVQPNQYHSTGRAFGKAETSVALSADSPFAEHVRRGYPLLAAGVEPLRRRGVEVVSLLGLFDDVEKPVYSDDCCHYTDTGQRLLAAAMADAFAGHVASRGGQ